MPGPTVRGGRSLCIRRAVVGFDFSRCSISARDIASVPRTVLTSRRSRRRIFQIPASVLLDRAQHRPIRLHESADWVSDRDRLSQRLVQESLRLNLIEADHRSRSHFPTTIIEGSVQSLGECVDLIVKSGCGKSHQFRDLSRAAAQQLRVTE
jgi:hypothetical protein